MEIMPDRILLGALQKRMRSVIPETEQEASIAYDLKTPVVSSIINERSQNKWGIAQGYRIQVQDALSPLASLQVLMICSTFPSAACALDGSSAKLEQHELQNFIFMLWEAE